ncbi:MAG TPA: type II toxin-antitoxin system RelB/DinJ family antitoxin [Hanamia sp.]|nr:type II toxin-antitoxin system RelB/DinJ family antitoxin [Hanamia sp.]
MSYNVAHEGGIFMTANAVVRARIDEHIKEEAATVLAAMGLTVSDAFRIMLIRIAKEKALPFEPLIPNAETIKAMKAARRGKVVTVGSVKDLLADLNDDKND